MRFPSIRQFANGVVANLAKAGAEAAYDRVAKVAAQRGLVPQGPVGKGLVFIALSYAGTLTEMNVDEDTLLGKVAAELAGDTASEFLSRAHKLAGDPQFQTIVAEIIPPTHSAL